MQAKPPHIPDDAGRIVVEPEKPYRFYTATVTSHPELARTWLDLRPSRWKPSAVKTVPAVQPVHVTDAWSLWDDGVLVVGRWMGIHPNQSAEQKTAPRPQSLPAGAVTALDLVAESQTPVAPAAWKGLPSAAEHQEHELDQASKSRYQYGVSKSLRRHDFVTPDGVKSLWEVSGAEGGMVGGEGDIDETFEIHDTYDAARRAYTDWKLA